MSAPRIIIPDNLKGFLEVENCDDFNMDRYYLTADQEAIFDDIIRMQSITSEMQKLKIDYLNTTLLWGVTGTGKTTFGKYVAYKLNLDFAYINFAKLIDGIFGNTARNISDVFRFMADTECVFMMDEIDCISQKRGTESSATGGEISRITITIMQELDYYKKHKVKSILIGATNRKDIMDEALLSRFSISHEIKRMKIEDKEKYIHKYLDNVGVPYNTENIEYYCSQNALITQRNIESDMIRCIAQWIENDKQNFQLTRIE